jgi:ankyrin repeat protein
LATPLHLACKNNRVDSAKFLIGCGVDANCEDEHGQMPILICCIHGHYDLAKILIDASIAGHLPEPLDVDSRDHRGLSALNCPSIKGDYKMCILLVLNAGASVDGTSPKGCTPLLYASRGGYADVVRFLLLKGASPLKQDNAGGTVIHHAIEKGHTQVLNTLLEHGFDVYSAIEIPDNAGRTPIFEAIDTSGENGIDNIKMLTRAREADGFDAKVNIMNYNG